MTLICIEEHLRSDARGIASYWQWEHEPNPVKSRLLVDISTCVATVVCWFGDGFHHVETVLCQSRRLTTWVRRFITVYFVIANWNGPICWCYLEKDDIIKGNIRLQQKHPFYRYIKQKVTKKKTQVCFPECHIEAANCSSGMRNVPVVSYQISVCPTLSSY